MRVKQLSILALSLFFPPLLQAEPEVSWPKWAQEESDIPASPRVTYGRLENGLRYALLTNQTPPGQVSLRLLVLAGSLSERDEELGYAHFLEHLAFRSTRSFPADEKVRFLQGLGVGFGPEVNAETTYTHTLYKLDLRETLAAALGGGLRILRDFADGLIFDSAEVDRERGVILTEAHVRRRPGPDFDLAYEGTIIPKRAPIGTDVSITKAQPAGLQSFYDAWYRPEKMVLVVVGDIDPETLAPLLQTTFASLRARSALRTIPPVGTLVVPVKMSARFFSEVRNGMQAELGTVRLEPRPPDTTQYRLKDLQLEVAKRMLRLRLNRLTNQTDGPISGFQVEDSFRYGGFRHSSIVTAGGVYKWPTVLATAEQELRRATDYGFDLTELVAVRNALRTELQDGVRLSATTSTGALADGLVAQIEDGRVYVFPDERLARVLANLDQLMVEDCRLALREAWGDSARYLFITASRQLIYASDKLIRAKYQESRDTAVAPLLAVQPIKFAYEDFGPPGEVVSKDYIADLDLWLVRFANGVRLNLKHTDFEHQSVRLGLRIGSGRLEEPVNQPGLSVWAGPAAFFGGVRLHTDDELARALNDFHVAVHFASSTDAFEISATSAIGEFPMALRFVTAYLKDAAFRNEGGKRLAGNLNDTYLNLEQSVSGVSARKISPFLAGGDPRLGCPPWKMVQGYSIATIGDWLRPIFETGAMEVALVGDFDVDQAIAEVARTFGALPARSHKANLSNRLVLQFPVPPQTKTYTYSTGEKNRPVTIALFWPVNEPITLTENLRLQMLGLILKDRLRSQIRVGKGETYSPTAAFSFSETYPGYADLHCLIDVRPERVRELGAEICTLALNLGKQGVTPEELERIKTVFLADVHGRQRDNGYWISCVLADAQERPWRLERARNFERECTSVTAAEINALAVRFLTAKNLFQFTIKPEYHRP
jgi:zinc protease